VVGVVSPVLAVAIFASRSASTCLGIRASLGIYLMDICRCPFDVFLMMLWISIAMLAPSDGVGVLIVSIAL
jgi:hypothetical protein